LLFGRKKWLYALGEIERQEVLIFLDETASITEQGTSHMNVHVP